MKEKHLENLYKLLEKVKKEKDENMVATIRWAIFTLETEVE